MEIFEGQKPVGSEGTEVNDESNQLSFVDQLVGEGKKELQAKQAEQDHAEALLLKLQEKATEAPVSAVPNTQGTEGQENTTLKPEDIESLLADALTKRDQESVVKKNLKTVQDALVSTYGTEAQAEVLKKAQELNVSAEFLDDLASKSPKSFLTLMGQPQPKAEQPIVSGEVNTSTSVPSKRDAKYYHEMLRKNPKQWKSLAMQQQMLKDKAEQGQSFFK